MSFHYKDGFILNEDKVEAVYYVQFLDMWIDENLKFHP